MTPVPPILQAAILGVLQGLTEFLPVSSSAHLVLLPQLLGWPYLGKAFDVALHFGTLLALGTAFRGEIERLLTGLGGLLNPRQAVPHQDRHLAQKIILGSVPVAFLGFILEDLIESHCQGVAITCLMLALGALAMIWAENHPKRRLREVQQLTLRDSWLIGLAQALALVPGVSRSGATMTAALALQVERAEAARFSFLLSLPVVAGASVHKAIKLGWGSIPSELVIPMLVGIGSAWATGYLCLRAFLKTLRHTSLVPFAVYRLMLAAALVLLYPRA